MQSIFTLQPIRAYFSPLSRFKRALSAVNKSCVQMSYQDPSTASKCEAAIRSVVKRADKAFAQDPKIVFSGLTNMMESGTMQVSMSPKIRKTRENLMKSAGDVKAHQIILSFVCSENFSKTVIDELQQSSHEMLKRGKVIEAFNGFYYLSRMHYSHVGSDNAAIQAAQLIQPCHEAGIDFDDLSYKAHVLQSMLPKGSERSKLMTVWSHLNLSTPVCKAGSSLT